MKKTDVVALGELLIDFACVSQDAEGYPTMAAHPGGAPANFLAALNQYGAKTALLGKVGNDAFGKLLIGTLSKSGIETKGIVMDDSVFTTLAFVMLRSDGNREFSFSRKPGADTCLRFDELNLDLIREAKVFHFGTLSLTDDPSKETTYQACEYAKSLGKMITFDPNLRKPLWDSLEEAKRSMEWGLQQADIVKISDEEIEFLWGVSPEEGAEILINETGNKLAFVTCGADGCFYKNKNAAGHVPAVKGIQVIDTTGAGDIFGGSALSRILTIEKSPDDLNDDELKSIVRFASAAAGLSTTKPGGISSIFPIEDVMQYQI